jgi:DNA gyrase subunit A
MEIVKGPDFPTGCEILGKAGIKSYLTTGKGAVRVRGKIGVTEVKGGREQLIISEIPYNVNRAVLVERIADLVNDKVITDIAAIRDESDEDTRVVIDLKRDANPKVIINNLFKHTALESSFSASMLAIDRGKPKLLNIKDAIGCYIDHRREIILRRTRFLLKEAESLAERLEALLIALNNLDDFIKIIRDSRDRDEAKAKLLALSWTRSSVEQLGILIRSEAKLVDGNYAFNDRQASAILDLRLYQLTGLEREAIKTEYDGLLVVIKDLLDILAKEARVMAIIKDELGVIKEKYGNPRKTQIVPDEGEISFEDLIANEGCIITITHGGFIKRTAVSAYRAQRRGGKGVKGMVTRDGATEEDADDFVEHLFTATTHDYLVFFTKSGRCYVERVYEIQEGSRTSKGRSIANLLELRQDEKIAATIRIQGQKTDEETWSPNLFMCFATKSGIVKKTNLSEFKNIRKGGLIAINIEKDDILIDCKLTNGTNEMVLITKDGMSIRFNEEEMRDQGRNSIGVWGIRPDEGDHVVAAAIVDNECTLLVAGANGIGKRTPFDEYRTQSRGGKGIITMKMGDKTGIVVGALTVREADELMLITNKGQMVRTRVKEIRETSRNTMGVKLIDLKGAEKLSSIAPVVASEEEDNSDLTIVSGE